MTLNFLVESFGTVLQSGRTLSYPFFLFIKHVYLCQDIHYTLAHRAYTAFADVIQDVFVDKRLVSESLLLTFQLQDEASAMTVIRTFGGNVCILSSKHYRQQWGTASRDSNQILTSPRQF